MSGPPASADVSALFFISTWTGVRKAMPLSAPRVTCTWVWGNGLCSILLSLAVHLHSFASQPMKLLPRMTLSILQAASQVK